MLIADPPDLTDQQEPEAPHPGHRRRAPLVTRRLLTLTVAMVGLLCVAVVPFLLISAYHTVRNSTGGQVSSDIRRQGAPIITLPPSPTGLLVITGGNGQPVGLTVLGINPSGRGGTAIVVPVATALERPEPTTVGSVYAAGGLSAQVAAIEELLGVRIGSSMTVDQAGLAQLLAHHYRNHYGGCVLLMNKGQNIFPVITVNEQDRVFSCF